MSRKKSTPVHRPFFTYELQNIIAGGILVTLAVLMFLSTRTPVSPEEVQPVF